jgi:RecJ-like exonuclease
MDPPVPELQDRAREAASALLETEAVQVVSHDDADGLTSAAIAATALEWAGLAVRTDIVHGLDEATIEALADGQSQTVLFTDLGSGALDVLASKATAGHLWPIVADHHEPVEGKIDHHLNPRTVGLDGGRELSGAGTAYVLARAIAAQLPGLDRDPRELAALAVVGAVGDRQTVDGELIGANRAIAAEGEQAGVLEIGADLALYGVQTRSLPKLLEYGSAVQIPGITGSRAGAIEFLHSVPVDLRDGDRWRTWAELEESQRQTVASGLMERAIERGVPTETIEDLVGERYVLAREEPATHLRDASEFATLLNATARYEEGDVGLSVCRGDRDAALVRARELLEEHRQNLSAGIEWVQNEGVTRESNVQWFHAGSAIRATIVGIVAGMALGADGISADRPIVGFADKSEEDVKVSARAPDRGARGLDLGQALREAAVAVGGEGGGHAMAAGATVPAGTEATVVAAVDEVVGEQRS